jgi:hypothetical protein
MFERVLPIFRDYLVEAAYRRGDPPKTSEAEMFAIIDYAICGFLAVIYRANMSSNDIVGSVRELLRQVARYGDRRCADVANYIDAGLPTICLPEFDIERRVHIYDLLRE